MSHEKRHEKNYRGGFGEYYCIPGCQSAFCDASRVKTGLHFLDCQKIQHCVRNGCMLLKDIGVLEQLINLVKQKKVMVCEFHFNPKQIRVSLGISREIYLPGSVPSVFEFKPEGKK